jgi:hypothetical protein
MRKKTAYRLLVVKVACKTPLGRPRRKRKDSFNLKLVDSVIGGVDWIGVAQNRDYWRALVNAIMNIRVPWNAGKLSSGYTTCGLSCSAHHHRVS